MDGYLYKIPFKKSFHTNNRSYDHREGLIIHGGSDAPAVYGEAAPLPGFSPASLQQVKQQFSDYKSTIQDLLDNTPDYPEWNRNLLEWELPPSLRFALDTYYTTLQAYRHECSIQNLLFQVSEEYVDLNVAFGLNDEKTTLRSAQESWESGFRTFKIKAGRNADREIKTLSKLRETFPEARLRIDANQAWSRQEALEILRTLESEHIEYCEQPIDRDDIEGLKWLKQHTSAPLAADEAVTGRKRAVHLIQNTGIDFLIIKPMRLGSYLNLFEICRAAEKSATDLIFTSSLDSGIGRFVTAQLAAGLGSYSRAHGLATGKLYEKDTWDDSDLIKSGRYYMPHPKRPTSIPLNREVLDSIT